MRGNGRPFDAQEGMFSLPSSTHSQLMKFRQNLAAQLQRVEDGRRVEDERRAEDGRRVEDERRAEDGKRSEDGNLNAQQVSIPGLAVFSGHTQSKIPAFPSVGLPSSAYTRTCSDLPHHEVADRSDKVLSLLKRTAPSSLSYKKSGEGGSKTDEDIQQNTLDYLYLAAVRLSLTSPATSRVLMRKFDTLLLQREQDLHEKVRMSFCSYCGTLLLPGVMCLPYTEARNSRKKKSSIREAKKEGFWKSGYYSEGGSSIETLVKNQMVYKCMACGCENVFPGGSKLRCPVNARRKNRCARGYKKGDDEGIKVSLKRAKQSEASQSSGVKLKQQTHSVELPQKPPFREESVFKDISSSSMTKAIAELPIESLFTVEVERSAEEAFSYEGKQLISQSGERAYQAGREKTVGSSVSIPESHTHTSQGDKGITPTRRQRTLEGAHSRSAKKKLRRLQGANPTPSDTGKQSFLYPSLSATHFETGNTAFLPIVRASELSGTLQNEKGKKMRQSEGGSVPTPPSGGVSRSGGSLYQLFNKGN